MPEAIEQRVCGVTEKLNGRVARWGLKTLAWSITRPIPAIKSQGAILDAQFRGIEMLCGLKFDRVDDQSRANILYSTGRGPRAQFDGQGGTLAYAYMPTSPNFAGQLGIYFDLDEKWSDITNPKSRPAEVMFLGTSRHETGHALGLDHSQPGELMAAIYDWRIQDWTPNDVARLQMLYGPPAGQSKPIDPVDPLADPNRLIDLLAAANAEIEVTLRAGAINLASFRRPIQR